MPTRPRRPARRARIRRQIRLRIRSARQNRPRRARRSHFDIRMSVFDGRAVLWATMLGGTRLCRRIGGRHATGPAPARESPSEKLDENRTSTLRALGCERLGRARGRRMVPGARRNRRARLARDRAVAHARALVAEQRRAAARGARRARRVEPALPPRAPPVRGVRLGQHEHHERLRRSAADAPDRRAALPAHARAVLGDPAPGRARRPVRREARLYERRRQARADGGHRGRRRRRLPVAACELSRPRGRQAARRDPPQRAVPGFPREAVLHVRRDLRHVSGRDRLQVDHVLVRGHDARRVAGDGVRQQRREPRRRAAQGDLRKLARAAGQGGRHRRDALPRHPHPRGDPRGDGHAALERHRRVRQHRIARRRRARVRGPSGVRLRRARRKRDRHAAHDGGRQVHERIPAELALQLRAGQDGRHPPRARIEEGLRAAARVRRQRRRRVDAARLRRYRGRRDRQPDEERRDRYRQPQGGRADRREGRAARAARARREHRADGRRRALDQVRQARSQTARGRRGGGAAGRRAGPAGRAPCLPRARAGPHARRRAASGTVRRPLSAPSADRRTRVRPAARPRRRVTRPARASACA
ncbi:phosphoserine phosphatase [Burkholderia pseudomallei]|nr:phosphoserine phosphatase [Burkholderia pseudomallei]